MSFIDRQSGLSDHDIRLVISRIFGALLFLGLLIGTAFPNFIFKETSGFLLLAGTLVLCAVSPSPAINARTGLGFFILSVSFVAIGGLTSLFSLAELYQTDAQLPLRKDYILRHAYFVFFWLPFYFGAWGFWDSCFATVERVCVRIGPLLLIMLAGADIATSYLWGDRHTIEWVGYAFYFEKFTFQFLFATTFLIYVMQTGNWLLSSALIIGYLALCLALKYGIMFNAFTGLLAFLILLISSVPILQVRSKVLLLLGLLLALWCFIVFGLFFPEFFVGDENNYWRLVVWRNNFQSLWDNYLLGVGFGTPYHPLTAENLRNTLRNSFDAVAVSLNDPIEPQYVRGQHSSFVNMFYRMGIVGGIEFLILTLFPVWILARRAWCETRGAWSLLLAGLGVYILQLVQMSVHVGIESPRFLVLYMLSTQFALSISARHRVSGS